MTNTNNDPEGDEQYEIVRRFIERKNERKPYLVYRILGDVDKTRWLGLRGLVVSRILHAREGSFEYSKEVCKPEVGICLDLLTHLAIDRFGNISLCVRFDPEGKLRIGHVNEGIEKAWNSEKRKHYLRKHIEGKRSGLPMCGDGCQYWGIPRGD